VVATKVERRVKKSAEESRGENVCIRVRSITSRAMYKSHFNITSAAREERGRARPLRRESDDLPTEDHKNAASSWTFSPVYKSNK